MKLKLLQIYGSNLLMQAMENMFFKACDNVTCIVDIKKSRHGGHGMKPGAAGLTVNPAAPGYVDVCGWSPLPPAFFLRNIVISRSSHTFHHDVVVCLVLFYHAVDGAPVGQSAYVAVVNEHVDLEFA